MLWTEGASAIKYFNQRGWDTWVLNYTTQLDRGTPSYPLPLWPIPFDEGMDAVRRIRATNIIPAGGKLGVVGFSAGGHLASLLLTEPDIQLDFGVLAYSVISMEYPDTHNGSRYNLLGMNASAELAHELSTENRVSETTPPVFLFHTFTDPLVPVKNALLFADAMVDHGRPIQALILPQGGHGIHLANTDPEHSWRDELYRWLNEYVSAG